MNNLYLAKIEMARDITEEDPNEDVQTNIVQATLYIEKIILLSNKKIGQDEISYIQVTLKKIITNIYIYFYRSISVNYQRTVQLPKNPQNTFFQHENEIPLNVTMLRKITEKCRPNFRKNSCIVVLGTTGRGKTKL